MYVPLHVKSDASLGLGTASAAELAARAAGLGLPAIALTDLENLYAQVRFQHECRSRGVRPIVGVELRPGFDLAGPFGSREGRLVLLARDRSGYESLSSIVTRRRSRPSPDPTDPAEVAAGSPRGLFLLSDDVRVLERLLARGVEAESLRFLLVRPVSDPGSQRGHLDRARELGLAVAADPDAILLAPEDHALHRLQVAIRWRRTVEDVERAGLAESADRRLADPADLAARFADVPEAVSETLRIAGACEFELGGGPPILPDLGGPDEPAILRLERACRRGLPPGPEYEERLAHELGVVRDLGLASYFLLVGAIAGEARRRGLECEARGSGVGSLIVHRLGLSGVDPVRTGLVFERFLHRGRADLPDLDLDLPSDRRDELIDWALGAFGPGRAAMVSSIATFQVRSAWREGLKALGMPPAEVERFARRLPSEDVPAAPAPAFLLGEPWASSAPAVERLVGRPRHVSVHPGGLVVAGRPLEVYAPLERSAKGVLVTQYDLVAVERIGLVKLDLLGNRALAELAAARALLGERAIDPVPLDDPETLRVLGEGRTLAISQLESPAIRSVLASLPLSGPGDVVAALALVRPGPASGEAKSAFLRRARGEEPPRFAHPSLETVLASSHGLVLFEEDVLGILRASAGFDLAEGDLFRAAIVRAGDDPETLAGLEGRFHSRARGAGVDEAAARAIWSDLARFASYSFSKAHAWSQAAVALRAAYLRVHHPVEFGCAALDHHGGAYPLRVLAADLVRSGVRILGPSVETSALDCRPEDGAIRVGLGKLRRATRRSVASLLSERARRGPFGDLAGLVERVPLSRRDLEALVLSGACDGLPPLSPGGYPYAHEAVLEILRRGPDAAAIRAFDPPVVRPARPEEAGRLERYRTLVRIRNELRLLEMHLAAHPVAALRTEADRAGCIAIARAAGRTGRAVRVAAILSAARRVVTRTGGVQRFLTLEDETGLIEAVLFPPVEARVGSRIESPGPYLVSGRIEPGGGLPHLVVSDLRPFHERVAGPA